MKKILFILPLLAVAYFFYSFTSSTEAPKPSTAEFKVWGNCGMCKERIEAALDTKGIKFAEWDSSSKMLKVKYFEDKITLDQIHKKLAEAGHDTEKVKASNEVYAKLHGCCKYDRAK